MVRKLMVVSVAALGLMVPLAVAGKAEAKPRIRIEFNSGSGFSAKPWFDGRPSFYGRPAPRPVVVPVEVPAPVPVPVVTHAPVYPGANHYHVLYRGNCNEPWREYGEYNCHQLAHEIEDMLHARGFEARIEHH